MSEWRKCPIGNVVTLMQGFAINAKSKHYMSDTPTRLPLLRIADMKNGTKEVFVKEDIPQRFIASNEDIIYTRTGNVGLVFRNNYGVVHNNCFTVTPQDERELSRDYLYYALKDKNFYDKANALARGAAQPDLPHSSFCSIEISFPSLSKQHCIASTLSRYDSLIDNYQKQIKLLEEAAQRLYKEWFAQNNNLETIKLVDISSKITDGVHNTVYNEEGSPYKLLSCKNVVGGHLMINSSERSISKDTFEKLRKRTQLEKGDILVSTVGSVGEVVYLDIEPDHFEFQRSVGIIKADKNVITPLYVYYSLLNRKNELKRTAHGAAQQCLFISDLKNFEIPIGSKEQIQNFEHFAKPISERITNARHQLRLLTESRDRLLPKLLSGEIEV